MMKFVCTAEQCPFGIKDEKRRTVSSVDFLNFCLNCEYLKIYNAEREESDRMDKIRLFAESRKKIAEKELEKLGYFDENWDRINDLVGGDIMLAYRLGIYESMYNLMNALLKVLDEEVVKNE